MAFAVTATLLAGCSSVGSLRNSTPTAVYKGDGAVGDVASCVTDAWSTKSLDVEGDVQYTGTTIELRQSKDSPVIALVDIRPVGATTVAKYYSNFPTDDTWYFERVRDCMLTTHATP